MCCLLNTRKWARQARTGSGDCPRGHLQRVQLCRTGSHRRRPLLLSEVLSRPQSIVALCEEKLQPMSSCRVCRSLSAVGRRVLSIESFGALQGELLNHTPS
ncbi:hypothetical protein P7K49_024787, partial [Saguinus oedipus]